MAVGYIVYIGFQTDIRVEKVIDMDFFLLFSSIVTVMIYNKSKTVQTSRLSIKMTQ